MCSPVVFAARKKIINPRSSKYPEVNFNRTFPEQLKRRRNISDQIDVALGSPSSSHQVGSFAIV